VPVTKVNVQKATMARYAMEMDNVVCALRILDQDVNVILDGAIMTVLVT
jgi:hypothetical protein